MPCRDDYAESRTSEENIKKLHEVTEMLCSFCKAYEAHSFPNVRMPEKVKQWWEQHKKEDKAREEREKQGRLVQIDRLKQQRRELDNQIRRPSEYE